MADPSKAPKIFSLTKTWHSEPYPEIDPTRPELSAQGKNIVITGGGSGIGKSVGIAFAKAGAKSIAIVGRRPEILKAGHAAISAAASDKTVVLSVAADLVDHDQTIAAFTSIAEKVGKIDVLVSNAGAYQNVGEMATYDAKTLMKSFELNVLTGLHACQAFLPLAGRDPIILNTSTAMAHIAPWHGAGAYPIGKAAALKMMDYISVENPHVRVVSIQPGWIPTDMNGHQKEAPDSSKCSTLCVRLSRTDGS